MIQIPKTEQARFEAILTAQSQRFGLTAEEYLRKIWYHEEASRLGEYMAMRLVDDLLQSIRESQRESAEVIS